MTIDQAPSVVRQGGPPPETMVDTAAPCPDCPILPALWDKLLAGGVPVGRCRGASTNYDVKVTGQVTIEGGEVVSSRKIPADEQKAVARAACRSTGLGDYIDQQTSNQ